MGTRQQTSIAAYRHHAVTTVASGHTGKQTLAIAVTVMMVALSGVHVALTIEMCVPHDQPLRLLNHPHLSCAVEDSVNLLLLLYYLITMKKGDIPDTHVGAFVMSLVSLQD